MKEGISVLPQILESKRAEIAHFKRNRPKQTPSGAAASPSGFAPRPISPLLSRGKQDALRMIAEIKFRSPSAGPLSTALDVESRARVYASGGVTMISVLCDEPFFDGGFAHLLRVRKAIETLGTPTRVLAKEFILDEVQLDVARDNGADSALLIARIVDEATLGRLIQHARALAIEPLVEVVDEAELDVALRVNARVIGVNARDLDTLVMDRDRAARVLKKIPSGCVAAHLSGVKTAADVRELAYGRADAALIGETLMRLDDPASLLRDLASACVT